MDAELMRALRPKITLAAAIRMHRQVVVSTLAAAITLPLEVAACFWATWAEVYAPEVRK